MNFKKYLQEYFDNEINANLDEKITFQDFKKQLTDDELKTLFGCYMKSAERKEYDKYINFIKSLYEEQ